MNTSQWNVWTNYSCYFTAPVAQLDQLAERIVESDFAPMAYLADGRVWSHISGRVEETKLDGRMPTKPGQDVSFDLPHCDCEYACEGVAQSIRMRAFEVIYLADQVVGDIPYIRSVLSACRLVHGDHCIFVYPQIKLYGNGAFIVEMRTLSGEVNLDTDSLIRQRVNLENLEFSAMDVPMGVLRLASGAGSRRHGMARWKTPAGPKEMVMSDRGYEFRGVRLDAVQMGYGTFSLDDLFRLIADALLNTVGRKPYRNSLGTFRLCRPNVFLMSYDGQPNSASEIQDTIGSALNRIMARIPDGQLSLGVDCCSENLRNLDDYLLFSTEALTLCVYAKKGLHINPQIEDQGGGHLAFPVQVLSELTDWAYATHRQFLEKSTQTKRKITEVLNDSRALLGFSYRLSKVSPYGEVRGVFSHVTGKDHLDFSGLRGQIEANLGLQSQSVLQRESEQIRSYQTTMSLVFGAAGAAGLSEWVVGPTLNLWLGQDYKCWQWSSVSTFVIAALTLYSFILVIFCTVAGIKAIWRKYLRQLL